MMVKEKMIFWPLLAVFIGISIFGLISDGEKKEERNALLKDIELAAATETTAKDKAFKDKWDFDRIIKTVDSLSNYKLLLERTPFFRISSEPTLKKVEKVSIVKEEPQKAMFKYKGRVKMGKKVMVIIEDQGTGKSTFVQEGDMVGDFLVSHIDDKEVALKKSDGEEIILKVVRKEGKGIEE